MSSFASRGRARTVWLGMVVVPVIFLANHCFAEGWTVIHSGTTEDLGSIWGSSEDDIYVGGRNNTLLHGPPWENIHDSIFDSDVTMIPCIGGSGADDVFLKVHDPAMRICHLAGGTPYRTRGPVPWHIRGVDRSNVFGLEGPLGSRLYRFSRYPEPDEEYSGEWEVASVWTDARLADFWALSPTSIFAVGGWGVIGHYDGSGWTDMTYAANEKHLYGVWAASEDNVFVVGADATLLHYDGSAWTKVNHGVGPLATIKYVWGSSGSDVYALVPTGNGVMLHYDGSVWSKSDPAPHRVWAMWGISPGGVYAIGPNGAILHYATPEPSEAPEITSTPVTKAFVSREYEYDVEATEDPADTLTYSLTEHPTGMTIDELTGLIAWTPTGDDVGEHHVVVQVEDDRGGSAEQWYALTVAWPLQITGDVLQVVQNPDVLLYEDETEDRDLRRFDAWLRGYVICPELDRDVTMEVSVTATLICRSTPAYTRTQTRTLELNSSVTVDYLREDVDRSFNFDVRFQESGVHPVGPLEFSLSVTGGEEPWTRTWDSRAYELCLISFFEVRVYDGVNEYTPDSLAVEDSRQLLKDILPADTSCRAPWPIVLDVSDCASEAESDVAKRSERLLRQLRLVALMGFHGAGDYEYRHFFVHAVTPQRGPRIPPDWDPVLPLGPVYGFAGVSHSPEVNGGIHGLGHCLGLGHTASEDTDGDGILDGPCDAQRRPGADHDWPYADDQTHTYGVIGYRGLIQPDCHDFMSTCRYDSHRYWTSKLHYERLLEGIAELSRRSRVVRGQDLAPSDPQRSSMKEAEEQLLVSGVIYEDGHVEELKAWSAPSGPALMRRDRPRAPQTYCVEAQDAGGVALDTQCFELTFEHRETLAPLTSRGFFASLSNDPTAAKLVVKHGEDVIGELTKSENAPVISEITLDTSVEGQATVNWVAADADGDLLTYVVLYSDDGGDVWDPLAVDLSTPSLTIELDRLRATDSGTLRVLASDGFHQADATCDTSLVVPDSGPTIVLDHDETVYGLSIGDSFTLSASAYDLEDGEIDAEDIVWRDDADAELGEGIALVTVTEEVSTYTVTATDSAGNESERMVTLRTDDAPNTVDVSVDMTPVSASGAKVTLKLGKGGPKRSLRGKLDDTGGVTFELPVGATIKTVKILKKFSKAERAVLKASGLSGYFRINSEGVDSAKLKLKPGSKAKTDSYGGFSFTATEARKARKLLITKKNP